MSAHPVARVDEIPPGACRIVEVAGRSIGVFNLGGEFFALRNRCPHQGGPLCEGQRLGAISAAAPGDYEHSRPGEMVRCPWHAWEFDIRTGQSWFDPQRTRVKAYPVEVRTGEDLVTAGEGDGAADGGMVPGPYVAETFPVSVEADYVVVELGRS
jgi:3-phenylpropionate/trans-cinnamate dioxygenase ferredoxin subunit